MLFCLTICALSLSIGCGEVPRGREKRKEGKREGIERRSKEKEKEKKRRKGKEG